MADAKIRVTLKDGRILEFEGSEEFVQKQVSQFEELIKGAFAPTTKAAKETGTDDQSTEDVENNTVAEPGENSYENVLEFKNGNVHIISDIPGKKDSEKTVSVALLHLLGSQMLDKHEVATDEIRDACEHHGCLNGPNFSKYLKGAKKWIVISGSRKKQTAKLTSPGKKAAIALASKLNEDAEQSQ